MRRYFILTILLFFVVCAAGQDDIAEGNNDISSPLFEIFAEMYPDKEILVSLEGDCNDDGISDLVVVYRENDDQNHQVTVYSNKDGFFLTAPSPAPYQDCKLEWRDVDERPPCELSVSGRRGVKFGFNIFRFVENQWINVYGEGMEECC